MTRVIARTYWNEIDAPLLGFVGRHVHRVGELNVSKFRLMSGEKRRNVARRPKDLRQSNPNAAELHQAAHAAVSSAGAVSPAAALNS